MPATTPAPDDDERVPIFGTWPRIYAAVILCAIAAELFPTEVRATAMGLSYNVGRGFSAAAPAVVGLLATRFGFGAAFLLLAAAFLAGALLALLLPETKGRALE